MEEHLGSCSDCQRDLNSLQKILYSLESLRGEVASRQLWPGVQTKLNRPSQWLAAWHLVPRPVLALAAVLLAVVIGLWFQDFPGNQGLPWTDQDKGLAPEQPFQEWFFSMPSVSVDSQPVDSQKEIDPLLASVVERTRRMNRLYALRVEGYRRPQEPPRLSELRARKAMEALVTSGVPKERIFWVDKGLAPPQENEDSFKGEVRLVLEPVDR